MAERGPLLSEASHLTDLDFRPSSWRRTLRIIGGLTALVAASVFAYGVLLSPREGTDPVIRYAGTAVLVAVVVVIGFQAITHGELTVSSTEIRLPRPIRLKNGGRSRVVAFGEIEHARPTVIDGYNGLLLVLRDGVDVFLPQSAFGSRGFDVMTVLASRLGVSYEDALKRILLEGIGGQRFRVASVRDLRGDLVVLRRAIPTFSGPPLRRFRLADTVEMEPVSTPYIGDALLVTLRDRTRFLVPKEDADRLQTSSRRRGQPGC